MEKMIMENNKDKFCVIIIAHGRPEMTDTYDLLHECGYTGKIIFLVDNEDKKVKGYYDRYGVDNVYMFDKLAVAKQSDPMNNFGGRKAAVFARNIAFSVAKELGYKYFCVLDGALQWNEPNQCYIHIGMYYGYISDGYTDDNRPNGAKVMLGNGQGTVVWDSETKTWNKNNN